MRVMISIWEIRTLRSGQPIGHIQAVPGKVSLNPEHLEVAFQALFYLKPSKLFKVESRLGASVFIEEETEASTI